MMQALPKALAARGHRVLVVAPRYKAYPDVADTGARLTLCVCGREETVRALPCPGCAYVGGWAGALHCIATATDRGGRSRGACVACPCQAGATISAPPACEPQPLCASRWASGTRRRRAWTMCLSTTPASTSGRVRGAAAGGPMHACGRAPCPTAGLAGQAAGQWAAAVAPSPHRARVPAPLRHPSPPEQTRFTAASGRTSCAAARC